MMRPWHDVRALALASAAATAMLFGACSTAGTGTSGASAKQAGGTAPATDAPVVTADDLARELDSLAAESVGPYVHLRVGACFGWCDARVSIWRDSPAHRYVYEAEAWRFDQEEKRPVRWRLRRQISQTEATALLTDATDAGLFRLVADTTMAVTDHSYFSLRAGGGPQTLRIDNAYTGGERYYSGGEPGLVRTFQAVQEALTRRLFGE